MASPLIPTAPKACTGGKSTHRTPAKPPVHFSPFLELLGDVIGLISLFAMIPLGLLLGTIFGV